jgi:hypothetical protein
VIFEGPCFPYIPPGGAQQINAADDDIFLIPAPLQINIPWVIYQRPERLPWNKEREKGTDR